MNPTTPEQISFAQLVDDAREFCAALDEGRDEDLLAMIHRAPYNEPVARGRLLRAVAALSR
jgi:hypothetical protein